MKLSKITAVLAGGFLLFAVLVGYLLLELYVFAPNREIARKEAFLAANRGIYPKSHPKSGWNGRPRWSASELKRWAAGPRTPISHVVHFRARLTVNGYPVVFDEFRECKLSYKREFIREGYRSRTLIAKKLPDGSIVYTIFLPQLCFNWQATRTRLPVPRDFKESVPSPKFLMSFYWADHATNPTRIEAYLSHAYHNQKNRRLVMHSHEVRLAPYPTPLKILKEAERQAASDIHLSFLERRGMQPARWRALYAVTLTEKEWSQKKALRDAVSDSSSDADFTDLDQKYSRRLVLREKRRVDIDWEAFQFGIPHPGINHHLLLPGPTRDALKHITGGLAKRTEETIDEAVPVHCHKRLCRILLDQRGYLIFYPTFGAHGMHVRDLKFIELNGRRIDFRRPARLLYWRPQKLLIAFNARSM